ncbi:SPOR domain-containing protein [Noviherbaspirillum aridicola]|uniref:SPOR domain-containing protein n=1 Tax=Noviherbaspirillum aridicola TaxID=2849687 RepID=A0ABQ4Q0Q0_9BURK|nr:SPOR domain-containing protein [Noviherbaspirillum aridicola]GIZ50748.1 hypothetical protein NCCP691_07620 [Noviherbaspirillum aridicola]
MLKVLFAVLLLANAGLFAWQRGHLDSLIPSGREPARVANQLNADKVKLVPPQPPESAAPVPAPGPAVPPEPQPAEEAVQPAPASDNGERTPALVPAADRKPDAAPEPQVLACAEIGDFGPEEARRFSGQLASLDLGNRLARKPVLQPASWVVHIPPQPDKEAVERKAGELRRLGVEDFFIILDNSPLRWGISLGVFKQEGAARAHLAALAEKGVRTARITPRLSPTGDVSFQLRKLAPQEKAALDRIAAGYAGQRLRACD